jgi:hypothetical protein
MNVSVRAIVFASSPSMTILDVPEVFSRMNVPCDASVSPASAVATRVPAVFEIVSDEAPDAGSRTMVVLD